MTGIAAGIFGAGATLMLIGVLRIVLRIVLGRGANQ